MKSPGMLIRHAKARGEWAELLHEPRLPLSELRDFALVATLYSAVQAEIW